LRWGAGIVVGEVVADPEDAVGHGGEGVVFNPVAEGTASADEDAQAYQGWLGFVNASSRAREVVVSKGRVVLPLERL